MQLISNATTVEELRIEILQLIWSRKVKQIDFKRNASTKTMRAMFEHGAFVLEGLHDELKQMKFEPTEDDLAHGPII